MPDLPPLLEPVPTPAVHLTPIRGAGLGFSSDALGVPLLPQAKGQAWDLCSSWSGLPLYKVGTLPTFVLSVPLPSNLPDSPYCGKMGQLLDVVTGEVIETVSLSLKHMANSTTLYVMSTGGLLYKALSSGEPNLSRPVTHIGPVRLRIGGVVSAPFEYIPATACYYEIRLAHTSPIGSLLYTNYGFEQRFGVSGILEGPNFITTADEETASGSMLETYVLTLDAAGESVARALSLAAQHTVVEVRTIGASGQVSAVVAAMPQRATVSLTPNGDRFSISLTLPVSETTWGSTSGNGACLATDAASEIKVIACSVDS